MFIQGEKRMKDSEIIQLYIGRSEKAIEQTSIKYEKYCYKIAYNILYNNEDSQECVNDTYLRAWNAIPPEVPVKLSVYLGKITRNLALNLYEKLHRQKRGGTQMNLVYEELEEIISDKNNPEDAIELQLLTSCINSYLKDLPKLNRLIFIGRYWYMDSVETISNHLGISQSKTKTVLFRTRNGLKEYYDLSES